MDKLAKDMINKFGEDSQLDIVVEELSELTKEVIKYKRTKFHKESYDISHLLEETADVVVVLDLVKEILANNGITENDILKEVEFKKQRTRQRYL